MSCTSRLAPVLMFAALLAAGCGGSSGSSGSTSATTGKGFIAQADPICKSVSDIRTAANEAVNKASPSKSKELAVLARVAPGVASDEQRAVGKLRALQPPSSLSGDWHTMLTGMQKLADDAAQIASDAKAKNLKEVESLTKSGRTLREQLTAIAGRDGFAYCGRTS
jgi:hypothetical protein